MKAAVTAPEGTAMVLHSVSLHAVIVDPLWGRAGGNWKSSWKRNPARSASGKPLSCKFLEAGKVLWLSITKCLFLACNNSQATQWSLLRPTGLNTSWESVSVHKVWLWALCGDLLLGLLWQPSGTYAIAFVKMKVLIQH